MKLYAPILLSMLLISFSIAEVRFPKCASVIDVTQAPYKAKGDGITDDTAALQSALNDNMGTHRIIYLPRGTYLISASLLYANKRTDGGAAWGFNILQGAGSSDTSIRLKDATFTDAAAAKPLIWCGGFGSADWFHNYVQDITFDVGSGNPGATGLQFYSNNTGAVRDCNFISRDGQGAIGLDLGHRDMNGPLLVSRVSVKGFRVGIATSAAVNSQTFEHIELSGQTEFGFTNAGQAVSIRGLKSDNSVIAVHTYGVLSLTEATLIGTGKASDLPAIVNYNGGRIGLRDVKTSGYRRALGDVTTPDWVVVLRMTGPDKPGSLGPDIAEYFSNAPTSPFNGEPKSLRLPIKETPDVPREDPSSWAIVDKFGADPTGNTDSSAAIQKAIDSGAKTIFFPGAYTLHSPVRIRKNAIRLIGTGHSIDYLSKSKPDFIVEDGASPVVVFEHFSDVNGGIVVNTDRTIVFKSMGVGRVEFKKTGDVFFEDVTTNDVRINAGQNVWARQLNVENEGTHITNAGNLWVLGYKTERGGTLLHTTKGGRSEIFGTFSYTTTAGKLAPMFVTEDASVFAFFSEICFNSDPFTTLIKETRSGVSKTISSGNINLAPYIGTAASDKNGHK